eukprot:CAMPEP_0202867466 /NCGR_PEP_ID=MMETSP1391-20130828/9451_1 /ASSEMBLY_ACC=CAM_ASM_000867 /TAXON_ID=1034604 /ORGANISM="Chlamydomonas leiostraca, Strain SAG 11-49" /LENGTH=315 /DNA_ID=CAMNT_0049547513 /DNA_START=22 /DNA_END=966 /DNA_ORIENTATION=+
MADEIPGEKINLVIKPTAVQTAKYNVSIEKTATVGELKESVFQEQQNQGAANAIEPANQRLIYKGQILKDERTVESYGIGNEHVLHLVRGRPQGETGSSGGQGGTTSSSAPAASAGPAGLGGMGLGGDPFTGGMMNPEAMQAMMSSPMMQSMLNNPELLRSMMQSNPMVQQLMERHPELAGVLNDPATLRQSLQIASNPALMREHMRHADRALSNIEAMPEGFNALRRMFENVQEPLLNATTGPDAMANNPLAALLGGAGGAGAAGAGAATTTSAGGAPAAPPSASPNASPLPNPWAPGGGAAAGAGAGAGAAPA